MSALRFEYFLVITFAIVSHFQRSPSTLLHFKLTKEPTEKCYEGLGCVKLTPEWTHRRHRPVNLLPADRHAVNTLFVHWILRNGNVTAELIGGGSAALKASGVGGSQHVKILIHDFTSNGYTGWIRHLSHALLTSPEGEAAEAGAAGEARAPGRLCAVSVDWAAGAEPPYAQAVANARLVALELVVFIKSLKTQFGIDPGQVHLIGHGVGAHIAGYVGKLVPGVQRITALDPNGPYFRGMPSNVKLHRSDASYVEVVHTDCGWGGQGNVELSGHVDFFPNGGKRQPGCPREWSPFGLRGVSRNDLKLGCIYRGCSHKRAFKYYIEALTRPVCSFIGYACNSYSDYVLGKCLTCGPRNQNCSLLSALIPSYTPPVQSNSSARYFITAAFAPFCVETLKMSVGVVKRKERCLINGAGYFNVTIPQTGGDVTFTINKKGFMQRLRGGYRHTFVVHRATPPITRFPTHHLLLSWRRDKLRAWWSGQDLFVSNITLLKVSLGDTVPQTLCGENSLVRLKLNVPQSFHPCRIPPMIVNQTSSAAPVAAAPVSAPATTPAAHNTVTHRHSSHRHNSG